METNKVCENCHMLISENDCSYLCALHPSRQIENIETNSCSSFSIRKFDKVPRKINNTEDMVNRPSHYKGNGIECIDAMLSAYGKEAVINFCHCNAFKYLWRANKKNGIEDLKKAQWYINKIIDLKEK